MYFLLKYHKTYLREIPFRPNSETGSEKPPIRRRENAVIVWKCITTILVVVVVVNTCCGCCGYCGCCGCYFSLRLTGNKEDLIDIECTINRFVSIITLVYIRGMCYYCIVRTVFSKTFVIITLPRVEIT